MSTIDTPQRDAKLAHYLGEAFGNEKRLETALQGHIAMTTRAPYKRRLRQHLSETRRHAAELTRRIKQLGGTSEPMPGPLGDAATALVGRAHKASALAQGPLHALRGTGEAERQLKNAKTEYADEAQEIGMYSAIEALAVAVADRETAQLARRILRDERRMLAFLEREIPRLTSARRFRRASAMARAGGHLAERKRRGVRRRTARAPAARGGAPHGRARGRARELRAREVDGTVRSRRHEGRSSGNRHRRGRRLANVRDHRHARGPPRGDHDGARRGRGRRGNPQRRARAQGEVHGQPGARAGRAPRQRDRREAGSRRRLIAGVGSVDGGRSSPLSQRAPAP